MAVFRAACAIALVANAGDATRTRTKTPPKMQLIGVRGRAGDNSYVVSELYNHQDAEFDLDAELGGQRMRLNPDTGSYALVVTSKRCEKVKCVERAFDPNASNTYQALEMGDKTMYGSGRIESLGATDEMLLFPGRDSKRIRFWEITEMGTSMKYLWMRTLVDGFLGMGHPAKVDDTGEDTVLEVFGVGAFTVCLGREGGQMHQMTAFGEKIEVMPHEQTQETPSRMYFSWPGTLPWTGMTSLETFGTGAWAVRLGKASLQLGDKNTPLELGNLIGPCPALIDTGSSIITMPPPAYNNLLRQIDVGKDCWNFDSLPDLRFSICKSRGNCDTGFDVVLPPSAYVKRIQLRAPDCGNRTDGDCKWRSDCKLRIGSYSMWTGGTRGWILGVPFMLEYMVEFDRSIVPPMVHVKKRSGTCPEQPPGSARAATQAAEAEPMSAAPPSEKPTEEEQKQMFPGGKKPSGRFAKYNLPPDAQTKLALEAPQPIHLAQHVLVKEEASSDTNTPAEDAYPDALTLLGRPGGQGPPRF